jgi:GntR family transcriptional regulator, rspAB operon transcriptional repressor
MQISGELLRIKDADLLKDRVYKGIKREILTLNFPPGMQLVEKNLCKGIGVSTSPIRDAFVRLELEGLVVTIPYKGCFVAKMSFQEFREIFQTREALEVYCLDKTLEGYSDEDTRKLRQIIERAIEYTNEKQEFEAYTHHLDFHSSIVEKLGNTIISGTYKNSQDRLIRYLHVFKRKNSDENTLRDQYTNLLEHFDMIDCIAAKDRSLALEKLRGHLSNTGKSYLINEKMKLFEYNKPIIN